MNAYEADPWAGFATAVAGAAAALAGLLFVAVSINLKVIVAGPHVAGRAAQALTMLTAPIFLALAILVPGQPSSALGVELIVLGAAAGTLLAPLCRPTERQPAIAWIVVSVLPAVVVALAPVLAGVGLLAGALGGLYWVPAAVALGLIGGLANAWVLLVEILR